MAFTVGSLITLVVIIIAVIALVWLAFYVLSEFPPPEPLGRIIRVAVVVFAVIIMILLLLSLVGVGPGIKITSLSGIPAWLLA
jgi:hypothetical protein